MSAIKANQVLNLDGDRIGSVVVDSIANMKNLNTEIEANATVEVLGYYSKGDGGGGTFYWDSTSIEDDNGGTIIEATGVVDGRWIRNYSGAVNVKLFGAKGTGLVEDDDTEAIQNALNYCDVNKVKLWVPVATYIINGELSIESYINLEGEGTTSKFLTQSEFKFTNPILGSVMIYGTNVDYQLKNMRFSTDDETTQRHLVRIGNLNDYASQNSAQSLSRVEGCVFTECGGTALRLGGEHYGTLEFNVFRKIAQAICVNQAGELNIRDCHFSSAVNPSFTHEVGNDNALIFIQANVTKIENCVFAIAEDYRTTIKGYDFGQLYIAKNKMEYPSRATFTYPIIDLSAVDEPLVTIDSNYIVASSAVGVLGQSMINLSSGLIRRLNVLNNSFTYSPNVDITTPIINALYKPSFTQLSNNYREGADNALIKFPESEPTSEALFGGINGASIDLVTVRSKPFNILPSQTNKIVPFGGRDYAIYFDSSLQQILPVSMSAQASTTIGGTVSFKFQTDSSNSDLCTLPSTNADIVANFTKFGLRSQYIYAPDQVGQKALGFRYTSDASVSTSVEYVLEFTYAIVNGQGSRFQKSMIDVS
jgi:hypothetical protein